MSYVVYRRKRPPHTRRHRLWTLGGPPGPVTETPNFTGATGGGFGPTALVGVIAAGALAGGLTPSPRAVPAIAGAPAGGTTPTSVAVSAIGGGTAFGTSPNPSAAVPSGGVAAPGTGPSALVGVTAGGAVAGGVAPTDTVPVTETPIFGGAVGGGLAPTARVSLTIQGAVAGGVAPTIPVVESPTFGGSTAAGVTPTARVTVVAAGALAGGAAPTARVSLTIGGATAAGVAATARTTLTIQGALAGGAAATSRSAVTINGAVAVGAVETWIPGVARVAVSAGGATAGGTAPAVPGAPDTPTFGGALAGGTGPRAIVDVGVSAAATFPTAGLLDTFNRANEGYPPTGWSTFDDGFDVFSNQLRALFGTDNAIVWSSSMVGADVEAYIELATLGVASSFTLLYARYDSAAGNGYLVGHYVAAGTDTFQILRATGGVNTVIGGPYSLNLANGDAFGIRCRGSTIQAWARVSGTWQLVGSVTDATYAGTGSNTKLALWHNAAGSGTTARFDNFGGGIVAITPTATASGSSPTARVILTLQGAIAAGREPTVPGLPTTPPAGGAIAGGQGPVARVVAARGGAEAAQFQPILPRVAVSAQGVPAGGTPPAETAPPAGETPGRGGAIASGNPPAERFCWIGEDPDPLEDGLLTLESLADDLLVVAVHTDCDPLTLSALSDGSLSLSQDADDTLTLVPTC